QDDGNVAFARGEAGVEQTPAAPASLENKTDDADRGIAGDGGEAFGRVEVGLVPGVDEIAGSDPHLAQFRPAEIATEAAALCDDRDAALAPAAVEIGREGREDAAVLVAIA